MKSKGNLKWSRVWAILGNQCRFVDPTFVGRFRAFGQAQGAQVFVCKSDGSPNQNAAQQVGG